jgi:hypothetical protein
VSLLIQEGQNIVEVARQAGHSTQKCLRTYAHVFEEFEGQDRERAEVLIASARTADVRQMYGEGGVSRTG